MRFLELPTEILALIGCPALLVLGIVLLSVRNYLRRVRRRLSWRSREEARGNVCGGYFPIFLPSAHPADFDPSVDGGGGGSDGGGYGGSDGGSGGSDSGGGGGGGGD